MAIIVPDPYGEPEVPYCGDCRHFHLADGDCADRDSDCGSYLCCSVINDDRIDMDDMPPGQINVNGANFGTISM